MNDTALTVVLATAITVLGFWVLIGLTLMILWRAAKKRLKRIESYVNQKEFSTHDIDLVKPRENLSKDETAQIRDFLRARKEREARDQNTIDIATEFNREV